MWRYTAEDDDYFECLIFYDDPESLYLINLLHDKSKIIKIFKQPKKQNIDFHREKMATDKNYQKFLRYIFLYKLEIN